MRWFIPYLLAMAVAVAAVTADADSKAQTRTDLERYESAVAGTTVDVVCPPNWDRWTRLAHLYQKGTRLYGVTYKGYKRVFLAPEACNLNTPIGRLTNTHEAMHIRHLKYTEGAVEACALDYLRSIGKLSKAILRVHYDLVWVYWGGICAPPAPTWRLVP